MKTLIAIIIVVIVALGGWWLFVRKASPTPAPVENPVTTTTTTSTAPPTTPTPGIHGTPIRGGTETVDMRISSPLINQTVSSPLTVSGSAKGSWFFEAVAPVALVDADGKTIARGQITAQGDWMTTSFVLFTGTLEWSATSTATTTAKVVFMNDNPSGDPALQKTVEVPVVLSR